MFKAKVQISGEALQVNAKALRALMGQGSALYELILDYTMSLSVQIAQATICNQFHTTEQRLARWLLTADDRVPTGELILTHDNMAQLLGVSRSRISIAAGALQKRGSSAAMLFI